jgi:hypothetical protein
MAALPAQGCRQERGRHEGAKQRAAGVDAGAGALAARAPLTALDADESRGNKIEPPPRSLPRASACFPFAGRV